MIIFQIKLERSSNWKIDSIQLTNRFINSTTKWMFNSKGNLERKISVKNENNYILTQYDSLGNLSTKLINNDSLGYERRIQYHPNGKRMSTALIKNGKKHGIVEIFNKKGEIIERIKYKNDEIIWRKSIDGKLNYYYPLITYSTIVSESNTEDTLIIKIEYQDLSIGQNEVIFKFDTNQDSQNYQEPRFEEIIEKEITEIKLVDKSGEWDNTYFYGYTVINGNIQEPPIAKYLKIKK